MDVDIDDSNEIEWAIATRFRPIGILSSLRAQGSKLDPSSTRASAPKWGSTRIQAAFQPSRWNSKSHYVKGIEKRRSRSRRFR